MLWRVANSRWHAAIFGAAGESHACVDVRRAVGTKEYRRDAPVAAPCLRSVSAATPAALALHVLAPCGRTIADEVRQFGGRTRQRVRFDIVVPFLVAHRQRGNTGCLQTVQPRRCRSVLVMRARHRHRDFRKWIIITVFIQGEHIAERWRGRITFRERFCAPSAHESSSAPTCGRSFVLPAHGTRCQPRLTARR